MIVTVDGESIGGDSADLRRPNQGPGGHRGEARKDPKAARRRPDPGGTRSRSPRSGGRSPRTARRSATSSSHFHVRREPRSGPSRAGAGEGCRGNRDRPARERRRSAGGGDLHSIFIDEGEVVVTRVTDPGETYEARGRDRSAPLVVLINRNTASAAEILAAALQQNDLGEIVGTSTYGKGVFQEVIDLEGGAALDLTVGEYLTADGTSPRQGRQAGRARPRRRCRRRRPQPRSRGRDRRRRDRSGS